MARRPTLILYTRRDCHLCEEAKAELARLRRRVPFAIEERDVDSREPWREAHGPEVPVGFLEGRKVFKYRVDPRSLLRALETRRGS